MPETPVFLSAATESGDAVIETLPSPYVYFGGKSKVAALIWERLGNVRNFVEPFFGSGAVLLGRPHPPQTETANDLCGYIANFWRAVQADPDAVAYHADRPVNENDLHAIHIWLVERKDRLAPRLEADPSWFDAEIAGRWVWGAACWIGSGWCSGNGPWIVVDGCLVDSRQSGPGREPEDAALGDAGKGVNRKLAHLGSDGRGVNRQLDDHPIVPVREELYAYMRLLAERFRNVRVVCGDWKRVTGPSVTTGFGATGIFLDPPYAESERQMGLYRLDSGSVSAEVRRWCIEHGDNPLLRICLAGYDTEHDMPEGWVKVAWKAQGGYSGQNADKDNQNKHRETLWFSKSCLNPAEPLPLFAGLGDA